MFLERVYDFAEMKHHRQVRKDADATPYIAHPLRVFYLLLNAEVEDEKILAGALLHDVLEDTSATYQEIVDLFGEQIANIVQEVSEDQLLPRIERRKEQVRKAGLISYGACLIKLADKIANMEDIANRPPVEWNRARKIEYYEFAFEMFKALNIQNAYLADRFIEIYGNKDALI